MADSYTTTDEQMSYICGMTELNSANEISVAFMFDYDAGEVTITMQGPSDQWFGVGFGASSMDGTYAIINEGNNDISERKLGDHNSGSSLTNSFSTESYNVNGDIRTVVVTRDITGSDGDYYTFSTYAADDTLSLIWGTTAGAETLEQHSSKGTGSVTFIETTDPSSDECTLSVTGDGSTTTTYEPFSAVCGMTELDSDNDMYVAFLFYSSMVYISMQGPASQWFGVGFGASAMENTYAIINEGTGDVTERKLGDHTSGSALTESFINYTSIVVDDLRTVIVERSITGMDSDYYTFDSYSDGDTLNLIWGTTAGAETLEKHSTKGTATVTFAAITDFTSSYSNCFLRPNATYSDSDDTETTAGPVGPTDADEDGDNDSIAYLLNNNYIISFSCLFFAIIAFF